MKVPVLPFQAADDAAGGRFGAGADILTGK
jgi:hypothetical protein